jgi:hypothetical protein
MIYILLVIIVIYLLFFSNSEHMFIKTHNSVRNESDCNDLCVANHNAHSNDISNGCHSTNYDFRTGKCHLYTDLPDQTDPDQTDPDQTDPDPPYDPYPTYNNNGYKWINGQWTYGRWTIGYGYKWINGQWIYGRWTTNGWVATHPTTYPTNCRRLLPNIWHSQLNNVY